MAYFIEGRRRSNIAGIAVEKTVMLNKQPLFLDKFSAHLPEEGS